MGTEGCVAWHQPWMVGPRPPATAYRPRPLSGSLAIVVLRLALVGFGNLGKALAAILRDHAGRLEREYEVSFPIVAVSDRGGAVLSSEPLPPARLLEVKAASGSVSRYPEHGVPGMAAVEMVRRAAADVLVEIGPTNVVDGEPGLTHIRTALERSIPVVTANKGPLVTAFGELRDLARRHGVQLMYGPATAAALPTVGFVTHQLAGSRVDRIEGILNGTTNYILTQMRERGVSYQEALRDAQALGIAEADPTLDVEGYDTAGKLLIIANCAMGGSLRLSEVARQGITHLGAEDVRAAGASGKAIKLVGTAWREAGQVRAAVRPVLLEGGHPLAAVDGTEKGITFHTDLLGTVTVTGGASGRTSAAASIVRDLLCLAREAHLP